jgi:hypothetical protein
MTVMETFFFQFAADGAKLKSGLAEADKGADKIEKGLQKADETAGKVGKSLEQMALQAGKALGALFALHKLKEITEDTADHTYAVAQQARALNMGVESLSAWQQAVKMSGGTAEGATESIKGLREKFVEMARFGGMMGPEAFMFQQLGLSAKDMHASIKDPMIAMGKLADTFGKLNRTQALFIGQKLGLDQGTINLLMQGRRGLDEMIAKQKELGVVTEAQAEAATKFKLKQQELGITFETVAREVTGALLPAITWLMDKVEKVMMFLHEHKGFAIGFFGALGIAITALALPPMIALDGATLAAAAPFLLLGLAIAAAIALIALIADDIYTFINGGDSVIGRAIQKWPVLGQIFKAIGEIIKMTVQEVMVLFHKLVDFVLHDIPKAFGPLEKILAGPFKVLWEILKAVFGLLAQAPVNMLNLIGKGLAALTGGKFDEINMVQAGKATLAGTNTPLNSMSSNTISNMNSRRNTSVSMGPIAIHTQATSGPAVRQAVGDGLSHHIKSAIDSFDDGIAG